MVSQDDKLALAGQIAQAIDRPKLVKPLTASEKRAAVEVRGLAHRIGVTAVALAMEDFQTIDA